MTTQDDDLRPTPEEAQALSEEFVRRAKQPSGEAARRMLEKGIPITYMEHDTPEGCVLKRHPNGKVQLIKVGSKQAA